MTKSYDPALDSLAQQVAASLATALDHPMSAEARQAVEQAQEKAQALALLLAPPTSGSIDTLTFDRLLQIAGPETAPSLLQQVQIDLETIRQGINDAAPRQDWKDLRHHSHVLISIAGSLGAENLGKLAEDLNRIANKSDAEQLKTNLPTLIAELNALLLFVRDRSSTLQPD